jgi:glycine betaine catabolism B
MLTATVKEIKQQTHDTKSYILELENETMDFKPGQHIIVVFEKDGKKVFRPYSLTSLPKDLPKFQLCIKRYDKGTASAYLHERKAGDKITFNKAIGKLFLRNREKENVFIATGTGITPMMGMIRQLIDENIGNNMWLFFGVRTENDIIFRQEFQEFAEKNRNFHFIVSLSNPDNNWKGKKGHIQDCMEKYIKDFGNKDYYVCGVPKMVTQTIEKLKNSGVKEESIYSEGWEKSVD